MSRSEILEQFRMGRVFVNGRQCTSNSLTLKAGDVVSLRGMGRLIYRGVTRTTKSGKLSVDVDRYV